MNRNLSASEARCGLSLLSIMRHSSPIAAAKDTTIGLWIPYLYKLAISTLFLIIYRPVRPLKNISPQTIILPQPNHTLWCTNAGLYSLLHSPDRNHSIVRLCPKLGLVHEEHAAPHFTSSSEILLNPFLGAAM